MKVFLYGLITAVFLLCLPLFSPPKAFAIPAFPGAQGFGSTTTGGRGGQLYKVTNLNDSGTGSLRSALSASGPRIVVFDTGGTIALQSPLHIDNPFITVAGQTAPGDGIMIRNYPLVITTHDVIVRGLRMRNGQPWSSSVSNDTFTDLQIVNYNTTAASPYNVIVDHNSFTWASGKNIALWYTPHDVTLSWNLIAEPLMASTDPNDGRGLLIGGTDAGDGLFYNISVHHNIFGSNPDRSPISKFDTAHPMQTGPEIINNLIYNWYWGGTKSMSRANIIGNQYIAGPNTAAGAHGVIIENNGYHPVSYLKDNIGPYRTTNTGDDWNIALINGDTVDGVRSTTPVFPLSNVTIDNVTDIYTKLLPVAGAITPKRDSIDTGIINDISNNTGHNMFSIASWPVMNPGTAPTDSDKDGMLDTWELAHGLNPNDPSDANKDRDGDGYTNIEEYINGLITGTSSGTPTPTPIGGGITPTPIPTLQIFPVDTRIEAESGEITSPFTVVPGTVSQAVTSNPTTGGKAHYKINIPSTGTYKVDAIVNASGDPNNSFYVNFDSNPTDPVMIWDILPYTTGLEPRTVSWRGSGTYNANEFNPKLFSLSSGVHDLYFVGREPNVLLDAFTVVTVTSKPGDANGDGHVDETDYAIWLSHYGQVANGSSNGDFNSDSKVDGVDYVIWLTNFGK